ncbi:hypothetical protein IL306_001852 [Fusarium sp. DS 682]|nr:hypothetical protein IL306_001852 [Fusarium sp. DS 682]
MVKVAPWKQRSDGCWSRPLIGPERMFDQWLEIDGWTEWMSAIIFTVAPSLASTFLPKAKVEDWFNVAVTRLCLEKPSLLAVIERGQEESAITKSRNFLYRPLTSNGDLNERVKQRTTVLHTGKSAQESLKSLTDDFYSTPEKRISIELGEHLIHMSLVASSVEAGTFALAIRCNHALNDFWSGTAILNNLLSNLADGLSFKVISNSYKDASPFSLHPCYLDILQNPIGDAPLDPESQEKAAQLLSANLNNITLCPIMQEPAKDLPGTDYAVTREVFSQEKTQKILQICKAHGVTVTALLTALQALALFKTFPPEDPSRTMAAPICVSNRLRQTSLGNNQYGSISSKSSLNEICKEAAYIGPVMATTFLVSPFDVSACLKNQDVSIGSGNWLKIVWEVAENVGRATDEAVKSNLSEHVDWTQGPAAFGGVANAMEAMKAGLLPSPPGMFTPLSSAGLLDGIHIPGSYGPLDPSDRPSLKIDDFSFYSRVSNLFGRKCKGPGIMPSLHVTILLQYKADWSISAQTWAWTALGKLNIILVMPDPRVRSVPNLEWWDMFKDMVAKMGSE